MVLIIYFIIKNQRSKSVSKVTILDESERKDLKENKKPVVVEDFEAKPGVKNPGMWHGDFTK